ncbi:MAG: zf-HC2 domain-containing protein [Blastocatellales bacterium]
MNCQHVTEILPWLLNGSLEAAEREAARAHLAQCGQCRQELQETAFAFAAHQQHAPEEALVDYAFNRPSPDFDRDLIERHLAECEQCAAELEMLEESHRLMNEEGKAEDNVVAFKPRPRPTDGAAEATPAPTPARFWAYGAIAASVIGVVSLIGWWWNWRQAGNLNEQQVAMNRRLAGLEAENQQLRQTGPQAANQLEQANREIANLKTQVEELSAPQINIPVLEVLPQELTERGDGARVNQLQIPRGARTITLILNSQSGSESKSYSLEILDARRNVVWRQQGQQNLTRHSTGDYTINISTELLPPGNYTFNVYGQADGKRVKIESYRIRIAG